MNDQKDEFFKGVNKYGTESQFGVFPIPAHTHNGTDSLRINAKDIEGNNAIPFQYGTFTDSFNIPANGNTDGLYKIIITAKNSSAFALQMRFNGDSGANYKVIKHDYARISGTGVNQETDINNANQIDFSAITGKQWFIEAYIDAQPGYLRTVNARVSVFTDNNNEGGANVSSFWNNTADNMTSINIICGSIASGKYQIYKVQ